MEETSSQNLWLSKILTVHYVIEQILSQNLGLSKTKVKIKSVQNPTESNGSIVWPVGSIILIEFLKTTVDHIKLIR